MASVWMDKKPLSTLARTDATHTAQKNSSRVPVQCTDVVVSYNTWEGLVKEIVYSELHEYRAPHF